MCQPSQTSGIERELAAILDNLSADYAVMGAATLSSEYVHACDARQGSVMRTVSSRHATALAVSARLRNLVLLDQSKTLAQQPLFLHRSASNDYAKANSNIVREFVVRCNTIGSSSFESAPESERMGASQKTNTKPDAGLYLNLLIFTLMKLLM